VGAPAGLVLTRARTMNELLSRPQTDRVVLYAGKAVDRTLPDYRELDYASRLNSNRSTSRSNSTNRSA